MLRITVRRKGKREKILFLEGKVCNEWVKELHMEIKKGMNEGKRVILDFSKVRYIDEEGARMLRSLPSAKVEKRNLSLFAREILKMEGLE